MTEDDGTRARVICGRFWGVRGPVDGIAADLGVVPNMAGTAAGSAALLSAFDGLRRAVGSGQLDPIAREVAGLRARGIPVVTFQPTSTELEVMSGDALDPANFEPVATRTLETTTRRLARRDVRQRLAALS